MAKWNNIISFAGSSTDNTGSVDFDGDSTITGKSEISWLVRFDLSTDFITN